MQNNLSHAIPFNMNLFRALIQKLFSNADAWLLLIGLYLSLSSLYKADLKSPAPRVRLVAAADTSAQAIPIDLELQNDRHVDYMNEHYVILIDPGHGGGKYEDIGSSAFLDKKEIFERDVMWTQALALEEKLKERGYTNVFKTKEAASDTNLGIFHRVNKIKNFGYQMKKPSICISLHWNNFAQGYVTGSEIYIKETWNGQCRKLAQCIQGGLSQIMGRHSKGERDEGIVERDYKLLRESGLSVLIEIGFASNENDLRKMVYEQGAIASAMADGIDAYSYYVTKASVKDSVRSAESDTVMNADKFRKLKPIMYEWSWKKSDLSKWVQKMLSDYNGVFEDPREERNIYLTFDCGYENGYTPKILDTLKSEGVKAAFFITGAYLKSNVDIVRRMLHEGHIVGNHSANHLSMPKLDFVAAKEEVLELERSYYDLLEEKMLYFRPPSGEFSERSMAISAALGYRSVFWSFAYDDWDPQLQRGKDFAYNKIIKNVRPGAIVLLHAVSKDNSEALGEVIRALRQQDYHFKSLNDLNGHKDLNGTVGTSDSTMSKTVSPGDSSKTP